MFANAPETNPQRIAYEVANIYRKHPEPTKAKAPLTTKENFNPVKPQRAALSRRTITLVL